MRRIALATTVALFACSTAIAGGRQRSHCDCGNMVSAATPAGIVSSSPAVPAAGASVEWIPVNGVVPAAGASSSGVPWLRVTGPGFTPNGQAISEAMTLDATWNEILAMAKKHDSTKDLITKETVTKLLASGKDLVTSK